MAHRYLTSWFLIDLIASLPYELMANDRSYRAFQLIKTVRLLRIRRLMRAWGFVFGANMLRVGTILGEPPPRPTAAATTSESSEEGGADEETRAAGDVGGASKTKPKPEPPTSPEGSD